MKILIINPPIRLTDKPRNIPHGLAILANIIRQKLQIKPTFLDINAHRYSDVEVKKILGKTEFDVVLIGGLIPVYKRIIHLANLIKDINPTAVIIAGGSAAMSVPDLLLQNSQVDIVCTEEGEITIIELLSELEKGKKLEGVLGIGYKKDGQVIFNQPRPMIQDLDKESALPAYDLLPMEIYLSNPVVGMGRDIDFISIRGCPYHCTFCYQPWGHKPRYHSVDFVIKALTSLKEKYRIDFVSFQDDEFMSNKARVYEFCEKKNRLLPDLLWSCTGRVNLIDEEIFKTMKNSGCVSISYGFESGSQRMLDSMRKGTTIEMMEKAVKMNRKYEMPIPVSFIIGMPEEDDKSCQETLDFCIRNNVNLDSLMFATPYPGTEIFDFALRTDRLKENQIHDYVMKLEDARDFTLNLTDYFSDEELINKREEMMRIARENYEKHISQEEVITKMKKLFGSLIDKYQLDEKEWEHRMKHGGISTF